MFSYEKIYHLNDLEMSIYNYIIENPTDVLDLSITDLAKQTHVSTATVSRFCKKVGLKGYPELKLVLENEIINEESEVNSDQDLLLDNLQKYKSEDFQQDIKNVVEIINQSNGVLWIGFGSSAGMCRYGSYLFSSSGKYNFIIDDPFAHLKRKSSMLDGSCIFILSVSGENKNLIQLVSALKQNDCSIVSITNHKNSTLAKMSDYNISYYVPYEKINNVDVTTQLPVMYIIESISKQLLSTSN